MWHSVWRGVALSDHLWPIRSSDQMKLCVTTISGIKCGFICLIICYIRCDNPYDTQCGDQPDHPVSRNWVWQQSVGCAVAEGPAAARSDGGVNRAITQVIMTMVIMATIIISSTEMNIIIRVMMQIMNLNNIKMANRNTNYSQRTPKPKKCGGQDDRCGRGGPCGRDSGCGQDDQGGLGGQCGRGGRGDLKL